RAGGGGRGGGGGGGGGGRGGERGGPPQTRCVAAGGAPPGGARPLRGAGDGRQRQRRDSRRTARVCPPAGRAEGGHVERLPAQRRPSGTGPARPRARRRRDGALRSTGPRAIRRDGRR